MSGNKQDANAVTDVFKSQMVPGKKDPVQPNQPESDKPEEKAQPGNAQKKAGGNPPGKQAAQTDKPKDKGSKSDKNKTSKKEPSIPIDTPPVVKEIEGNQDPADNKPGLAMSTPPVIEEQKKKNSRKPESKKDIAADPEIVAEITPEEWKALGEDPYKVLNNTDKDAFDFIDEPATPPDPATPAEPAASEDDSIVEEKAEPPKKPMQFKRLAPKAKPKDTINSSAEDKAKPEEVSANQGEQPDRDAHIAEDVQANNPSQTPVDLVQEEIPKSMDKSEAIIEDSAVNCGTREQATVDQPAPDNEDDNSSDTKIFKGSLPAARPRLISLKTGDEFLIGKTDFRIGMAPSNDLVIEQDPITHTVSRKHAVITMDGGLVYIKDISANGTFTSLTAKEGDFVRMSKENEVILKDGMYLKFATEIYQYKEY